VYREDTDMKRCVLLTVAVLAGCASGQEIGRGDEHRFQGDWEMDMTREGYSILGAAPGQYKWVIQGNKVTPYENDRPQDGFVLRLDEAKQPRQLHLTRFWRSTLDASGLYRLDRDTITIYMDYPSQGREVPASADAKGLLVITLRRSVQR